MVFPRGRVIVVSAAVLFALYSQQGCNEGFESISNGSSTNQPRSEDPPPPPLAEKVPAFVVTGNYDSTIFSCDGGESWKDYKSKDNNFRCFDANFGSLDCNHDENAATGIAYGNSGFIATFGWESPGFVKATQNGRDWHTLFDYREAVSNAPRFASIAFGNGKYVLSEIRSMILTVGTEPTFSNQRISREAVVDINNRFLTPRRVQFLDIGAGIWISAFGNRPVSDFLISRDQAVTFVRPNTVPNECYTSSHGSHSGLFFSNGNRIIMMGGVICYSDDEGATWSLHGGASPDIRKIQFDGSKYFGINDSLIYTSVDGLTWVSQPGPVTSQGAVISVIDYHPSLGRYIAITRTTGGGYETTQFFYSDDLSTWTRVAKENGFAPLSPHNLRHSAAGFLDRSELCTEI